MVFHWKKLWLYVILANIAVSSISTLMLPSTKDIVISTSNIVCDSTVDTNFNRANSKEIIVEGSTAYTFGYEELLIFDISNPEDPQLTDTFRYNLPMNLKKSIYVNNSIVLVTSKFSASESMVYFVDCRIPKNISVMVKHKFDGHLERFVVRDNYCYGFLDYKFVIFNLTRFRTEIPIIFEYGTLLNNFIDLYIYDEFLYIIDGSQMRIFNISDISNVHQINSWSNSLYPYDYDSLICSGDRLYLTYNQEMVIVLDISDPTAISLYSQHIPGWSRIEGFTITDNIAILLMDFGLEIIDITSLVNINVTIKYNV